MREVSVTREKQTSDQVEGNVAKNPRKMYWRGRQGAWEMSVIREKEISEGGRGGRRNDKSTKNCRNVKVEANFPLLPSLNESQENSY